MQTVVVLVVALYLLGYYLVFPSFVQRPLRGQIESVLFTLYYLETMSTFKSRLYTFSAV